MANAYYRSEPYLLTMRDESRSWWVDCPTCEGTGTVHVAAGVRWCPTCHGQTRVPAPPTIKPATATSTPKPAPATTQRAAATKAPPVAARTAVPRIHTCAQCGAPYGVRIGPADRLDPDVCSTICQTARQDGAPVCNLVGQEVAA